MAKKIKDQPSRRQLREERAQRQVKQRNLTIGIIIGAVLLLAAIIIYPTIQQQRAIQATQNAPLGEFVKITPVSRPQADFNAMGDPNAPVRIDEYSDFQCPYCKMFKDETEKQIVDAYVSTGKVYFVYHPYGPGGQYIGQESHDAALAAFCAADQGKFWEYHDMLFANQKAENAGDYTPKRLAAFAETLGLDMAKFNPCFDNKTFESKLNEGIAEGRAANVGGTPSFVINGKLVQGAVPFAQFQTEIDTALAGK